MHRELDLELELSLEAVRALRRVAVVLAREALRVVPLPERLVVVKLVVLLVHLAAVEFSVPLVAHLAILVHQVLPMVHLLVHLALLELLLGLAQADPALVMMTHAPFRP